MLKKLLLAVAVVVIAFLIIVALQPADYRVARSVAIAAPASVVFTQVNDLHRWEAWSPWAKLDPAMKQTYEGAAAGKGAVTSWAGNKEVGEGRMTIVESRPDELVRIKLDFLKPMASTANSEFTFDTTEGRTIATWSMSGQKNFLSKAVCLFMNMDKMLGGQFEQGLANLKKVSEGSRT